MYLMVIDSKNGWCLHRFGCLLGFEVGATFLSSLKNGFSIYEDASCSLRLCSRPARRVVVACFSLQLVGERQNAGLIVSLKRARKIYWFT